MKAKKLLFILRCRALVRFGCSSDEFVYPVSNGEVLSEPVALSGGGVGLTCGDAAGNVFVYGMEPGGGKWTILIGEIMAW